MSTSSTITRFERAFRRSAPGDTCGAEMDRRRDWCMKESNADEIAVALGNAVSPSFVIDLLAIAARMEREVAER